MIKYIHFRFTGADGGPSSKGGITVAYDQHMLDDGAPIIRYSFAVCSPKDHYNKTIGRSVSSGRLHHGQSHEFRRVEGVNIVEQIINHHDDVVLRETHKTFRDDLEGL